MRPASTPVVLLGALAAALVVGLVGSVASLAATTGSPPRIGKGKEIFSGAISAEHITSLKASLLPPGTTVRFRCIAVCSRTEKIVATAGGSVSSTVFPNLPLTDGMVFTGAATKPGWVGFFQVFRVQGAGISKSKWQCIPPKGPQTPQPCTTEPPSTPTGLHATDVQQTTVTLNWSANPAAPRGGYYVYLGRQRLADTRAPQWTFKDLSCATTYSVGVAQHDALYNVSTVARQTVQTLPCTPSGRAIGVSFNSTRSAAVVSVSCARRGECAAGGYYRNGSVNYEAFVVDETGGVWAKAIDVPGLAGLNIGGDARVNSISCSSAGNCAAGGRYDDGSGNNQAFVVEEKSGVWDVAIPVPDLEALNAGGAAEVSSISCASPGNCVAGGFYRDGSGQKQAFVAQETSGIWGSAAEVPGTADLNLGGAAAVKSVSCPSIGNCVAGGSYLDGSGLSQAFVVSEENDVWGAAIEVPGSEALNLLDASVLSVSCGSAGDCAAGGYYGDVNASSHTQAFVVNEENGVWGAAIEVPGSAALNLGDSARVTSISCASAGNCAAGGWYTAGSKNHQHPFLVNETGGTWGSAVDAPGIAALNGGNAQVTSISCAAATTCVAGGYFTGGAGAQAFVVSEMSGVWGTAIKVPGTATLNVGGSARVNAVSCVSTGECVAGGAYRDGSQAMRAFVTTPAASLWFASRLSR